jgi:NSS family neurotransmitter:Na+ symporter
MVTRGQWATRMGFILACAGSAIGLGNIWKFPYIAGMNGGGFFVFVYIFCVLFVGIPIMISEFAVGRSSQLSPVEAFRSLTSRTSPWQGVGCLGVLSGFVILSFYSVVAGWTMHYVALSVHGFGETKDPEAIEALFGELFASAPLNLLWHFAFMALTVGIVVGGVRRGIERASRIMMPVLFVMLVVLLVRAMFLPGFGKAFYFIFSPNLSQFTPTGALVAMGHAFFTLSLGMGAMLTYGSYLAPDTDVPRSALIVALLDTAVALLASMVIFPILFTYGMSPQAGTGLVFKSMPIVFAQLPAGGVFSLIFFLLLAFAALSSGISLLEVVVAFFIDTLGWRRIPATLVVGAAIFAFGSLSALSGSALVDLTVLPGKNFFDSMDYLASNWFLPLGGMFIALFVGFRMDPELVKREFCQGSALAWAFVPWVYCVRFLCPLAVAAVFIYGIVN